MAKISMTLCDVKPCTFQAEREFEVNSKAIYVCGEQCFARFWSREYGNWKQSRYTTKITFHHRTQMQENETQEVSKNGSKLFRSDLKIVKPRYG
jgi:hypothetical protein